MNKSCRLQDLEIYDCNVKGYENLANAIIEQAVIDFKAYYKIAKTSRNRSSVEIANWKLDDLRHFFKGNWFIVLSDLDGAVLLDRLEKILEKKYERKTYK